MTTKKYTLGALLSVLLLIVSSFSQTNNAVAQSATDCNQINLTQNNGNIIVDQLAPAPITSIQVFDANWKTVYNQFFTNSPSMVSVPNLAAGKYFVKSQLLTAGWSEICKKEAQISLSVLNNLVDILIPEKLEVKQRSYYKKVDVQIHISKFSDKDVQVHYQTQEDPNSPSISHFYQPSSGTAIIPAGSLCTTVSIPLLAQYFNLYPASFKIRYSNPANANLPIAETEISFEPLGEDPAPSFSISRDITVDESKGMAHIIIQRTSSSFQPYIHLHSIPGTASSSDIIQLDTFLNIPYNVNETRFDFPIVNDGINEPDESFTVISDYIYNGTATITIKDDDQNSTLYDCENISVSHYTGVLEVSGLRAPINKIELFDRSNQNQVVLNESYSNQTLVHTFTEIPEGFYAYKISYALQNGTVVCSLEDDITITPCGQEPPIISIVGDITVNEGDGFANIQVLSENIKENISVDVLLIPGSARGGFDYNEINNYGTYKFNSFEDGLSSIKIPILDDYAGEPDEEFTVTLVNPSSGLLLGKSTASVTIVDDNTRICNHVHVEETANSLEITGLTSPIYLVKVYDEMGNLAPESYTGVSVGTSRSFRNLAPGKYLVHMDFYNQNWEIICNYSNYYYVGAVPSILPTLTISDETINELSNNFGLFRLNLSKVSSAPIRFQYNTKQLTAKSNIDFEQRLQTITIPPGDKYVDIAVSIIYDPLPEETEEFIIELSLPQNVILERESAKITILDVYEEAPSVEIGDITVNESDGFANVSVCLNSTSNYVNSFYFSVIDGSALIYKDYTQTFGRLDIPVGVLCVNQSFKITNDSLEEPTENFTFTLKRHIPDLKLTGDSIATITIIDDDNKNPCENITIDVVNSSINITGLSSPIYIYQIFDKNWNQLSDS